MTSITLGQGGASFIPHIRPIQRHLGFLLRQWLAKYLPLGIQPSDHSEHNVGGDTIVLREGDTKGLDQQTRAEMKLGLGDKRAPAIYTLVVCRLGWAKAP